MLGARSLNTFAVQRNDELVVRPSLFILRRKEKRRVTWVGGGSWMHQVRGHFETGDRMHRHAVSTGSQRTDFLPVGARRMLSHARRPPGQPCIPGRLVQSRRAASGTRTYQPTWRLSTRDQPCNKCVAAGSGSASTPVGAGTRTMDEVS